MDAFMNLTPDCLKTYDEVHLIVPQAMQTIQKIFCLSEGDKGPSQTTLNNKCAKYFIVVLYSLHHVSTNYLPCKFKTEVKMCTQDGHKTETQWQEENNSIVKMGTPLLQLIVLQSWAIHCCSKLEACII